ncbi:MAG: MmcQ/YjbR family DNA-binding protein [Firmicutes bacterium]|nr:MmcQ/YjbR family DNA-binding protein [Bacillota bacterium]
MTRAQLIQEISEHYGTEPEYIFRDEPDICVFRHAGNRKWFAIIMKVSGRLLGLKDPEPLDVVNFKADPLYIGSMLREPGFHPAYHMNKTHWITAVLESDGKRGSEGPSERKASGSAACAADEDIQMLLDQSFELTAVKGWHDKRKSLEETEEWI